MDFNALKTKTNALADLQAQAEKLKNVYTSDDSSVWTPTLDKAGNGFAIIRFLPAPFVDGDDAVPFVKYYRHSFQGPLTSEWYIENCLTSLGKKDPCNDIVRVLYKTKTPHDEKLAGLYKRKTTFVSNILVVKDPAKPENERKVFRFKYGLKIWNKIEEVMFPKFGAALNPFHFWEGANFGLIVKKVGDWPNYDSCKFDVPSVLSADDNYLKEIWEKEYSLKEYLDEKNYKSYDELKTKLDSVLSYTVEERGSALNYGGYAGNVVHPTPTVAPKPSSSFKGEIADNTKEYVPVSNKVIEEALNGDSLPNDDGDEEGMDYFKNLAKGG